MMTALIAAKLIQIQLPLITVTSLAALAACWWLVPMFGMQGAAWSLAVSKLPYLIVGLWLIARLRPVASAEPAAPSVIAFPKSEVTETRLKGAA